MKEMNMNVENTLSEMREYVSSFEIFSGELSELLESENRIDEPNDERLEARIKIVGEKYEDELSILDRGGLSFEVPLGEFDRIYTDSWGLSMKWHGDDSYLDYDWNLFHETFWEKCLLKRVHEDFQYPLVRYLETAHEETFLGKSIVFMKDRDPDIFVSLPFSDELKENWEPLMKLLKD